jgi:hypothetical protein
MARLAAQFTDGMPPELRQDYLISPAGPLLSGTSVPVPAMRVRATASGLLVPERLGRGPSLLDQMSVYLTGSEILGVSPDQYATAFPPNHVEESLSKASLETVALLVADVLQQLHTTGADQRQVDRELANQLLEPRLASRVQGLLQDPQRRFLAPQVLLVLLKIACAVSTNAPVGQLGSAVEMSSLFTLAEYLGADGAGASALPGTPGRLGRLVISTQIFYAHPDEANHIGRFIQRWLHSPAIEPRSGRPCDLPALFETATGVPLGDWITVGIALYAHLQAQPRKPAIDLAGFARALGWTPARLEAVLRHVCTDVETLRELVAQENARLGRDWAFGTFEQYPLLRLSGGQAALLDPHLIMRRFFSWLPLFDLKEGLKQASMVSEAKLAEGYMRTLSEQYATDVLAAAVASPATKRVYDDAALKNAFQDRGSQPKVADAAVDYGNAWVVVEVTTSMLTRKSTAGVSDQDVVADIDKLVGEVEQIASTIRCLREGGSRLTGAPAAPHPRFYPLLVVTEGFPVNPITLPMLREAVRTKNLLAEPDMAPLEVVDLVELEALEWLGETSGKCIVDVLAAKNNGHLATASVRDFITLEMNELPGRPQRLETLWTSVFDVVADTLGVARRQFRDDTPSR